MKYICKHIRNFIVLMVSLVMVMSFVGCDNGVYLTTGVGENQLLKVSGQPVPLSVGKLLLATTKNMYTDELGKEVWDKKVDGKTVYEILKINVKNQLTELKTINMLADEKNIKLAESEKKVINKAAKEYFNSLSDKEKKSLGVTLEDINTLYTYFLTAEKLYELTVKGKNIEISDEEARIIKVQYCFVKKTNDKNGTEVAMSEDEIKSQYKKISNAYKKISKGEDFITVTKEYSQDEIYEYEFGRNHMEKAFEEAAFELATGEVSGIVTGEKGFYIIKCINSNVETKTEENKLTLLETYKNKAFMDIYKPFMNAQTYEYNDKVYDSIDVDSLVLNNDTLFLVYEKYMEGQ